MPPSDRLTWRQSFQASWSWTKWLLTLYPGSYLMIWAMNYWIILPSARNDPRVVETMNAMYWTMPIIVTFIWLLIYFNGVLQARWQETPMQREQRERNQLARLQEKYRDQP
jgi:hypothetical protein